MPGLNRLPGLNRRRFLERTALTGLGVRLAGSVGALVRPGIAGAAPASFGYGPLLPDPSGLLALPLGFAYTVVGRSGDTPLDGGAPLPSDPDANGARNELNDSEFCGPAFSGDGRTLYVNIQSPDIILAITGPWRPAFGPGTFGSS